MKRMNVLRIIGIALILSLLSAVLPVLPAFAAESIIVTPTQAQVGASVSFSGSGYPASADEWAIDIYISDQTATVNTTYINIQVTRYKKLVLASLLSATGTFSGSFTVPATLNEGLLGTSSPLTLAAGSTYYIYACGRYQYGGQNLQIHAITNLTISANATLDPLSPASGPAGTSVLVTGSGFPGSTALVFKFDTTVITPTSGHTSTLSNGLFLSYITIPSTATVGSHTINVTAGSATVSRTFTVTASAAITLSVASGAAGSTVTVTGTGYPASTALVFKFDTTTITPTSGDTSTSVSGTFYTIITVPSTATVGTHAISATASTSTDSESFVVTSTPTTTPPPTTTTPPPTTTTPPPTTTIPPTPTETVPISFIPSGDTIGSTISIGGSGFTPDSTITITYDDIEVATAVADSTGFFVAPPFQVPPSQHGEHTITATDGIHIGAKTYTVESTPPSVPQPLLPAMGEAVSQPASFDWDDVTDASAPVTYNLQIATSDTFDADSIIIDKTGLTASEYMLTEADQLKLSSEVTYYWREQAVDAALNASAWTGAGEFTIVKPFEFTGWPLYLTIGLGGLVLFLLGL
ncbi:MAG: hypothetical protein A2Y89_05900, partial [Chloroflexi bacterium RBG_13_51_18]